MQVHGGSLHRVDAGGGNSEVSEILSSRLFSKAIDMMSCILKSVFSVDNEEVSLIS